MDDLMQMKQSLVVTIQRPPRLLRGVLTGVFAALSLIFLREFVYWLMFTVQYASLSQMIVSNIATMLLYGVLTVAAAIVTWRIWPRGPLSAPLILSDDDDEEIAMPKNANRAKSH